MAEDQQQQSFSIEKIYVKDISVEVPGAPGVFRSKGDSPQVEMSFTNQFEKLEDDFYEVVIKATINAKSGDSSLFLVEVVQAGIFQLKNIVGDALGFLLGGKCPNIMFPYLRETISDLVNKAGFPPVLLQPMDFESIYRSQHQSKVPEVKPEDVSTH